MSGILPEGSSDFFLSVWEWQYVDPPPMPPSSETFETSKQFEAFEAFETLKKHTKHLKHSNRLLREAG